MECQQPSLNKLRGDRADKKRNVVKEMVQDFTQMTPLRKKQTLGLTETGQTQSFPQCETANSLILIVSLTSPRNIKIKKNKKKFIC